MYTLINFVIKWINSLMRLYDYMASLTKEQISAFAINAGTTAGYLELLKGNHRQASSDLCKKIETASSYKVTRFDLRPDFFEDLESVNQKISNADTEAA